MDGQLFILWLFTFATTRSREQFRMMTNVYLKHVDVKSLRFNDVFVLEAEYLQD